MLLSEICKTQTIGDLSGSVQFAALACFNARFYPQAFAVAHQRLVVIPLLTCIGSRVSILSSPDFGFDFHGFLLPCEYQAHGFSTNCRR